MPETVPKPPPLFVLTVEELIQILQKQPPKAVIVLSKDGEGNEFKTMHSYGVESFKIGRYGRSEPCSEHENGARPCVVLWPA